MGGERGRVFARPLVMEHDGLKGILESGRVPGLHGLRKGRGWQPCFERPDPEREVLNVGKVMEEQGKLTPEAERNIKRKLEKIRSRPPAKPIDYGKEGHPAFDQ